MRRDCVGAGVLVLAEAYLYGRYAQLDAEFHYWLHGLLGAALGLSALAATAVLTAGRRRAAATAPRGRWLTPWEAAGLGHLYAGFPDILFLTFGLPHEYWMDAFGLHITAHFIPTPVLTALALFLLGLLAYGLARSQRRGSAAAALGAGGLALVGAVALAPALPTDVADLRADPRLASSHSPGGRAAATTSHQEH